MASQIKYLDNAKIITGLSELPKIGEPLRYCKDSKCISIEAYENETYEDYLFYAVKYWENNNFLDLECDIVRFSYCIKKSDAMKGQLK